MLDTKEKLYQDNKKEETKVVENIGFQKRENLTINDDDNSSEPIYKVGEKLKCMSDDNNNTTYKKEID